MGLLGLSPSDVAGTEAAASTTFSAIETIPVPPAASYAGSGGGDGWALVLSDTAVYNVFHHSTTLQVACHLQADATACWSPRTIKDPAGSNFATSGQPGLWLDHATERLYVYATRNSDQTGGVVCIDTIQAAGSTNPFCGFTALTAVGEAPLYGGISTISNPTVVGSRWFAFNYVSGKPVTGTENTLLCFDLTTFASCTSQPFTVTLGSGNASVGAMPNPAVAAIGSQIIVPITVGGKDELACFDGSTGADCSGNWPLTLGFSYDSRYGAPFPLLTATGDIAGLCLPTGTDPCYTLAGAAAPTPAGMTSAIRASSGWDGPAFVLGPRVYVPNGIRNTVDCYDANTSASCTNFPKQLSNLSLLYTVNSDPQRPTCAWVNSDRGSWQIQSFDVYTGGPCGQGAIRVLASRLVAPAPVCTPLSYTSLQVLAPPPTAYSGGSVAFDDGDGNPIPGTSPAPLDSTGTVDLTGLNLSTSVGLPQFLITLDGTQGTPTAVTVKLTWTGTDDPACHPVSLTLEPASSTKPAGGTHTVTATLTQQGQPVSGQVVSLTITGQNNGVSGTCDPADCTTDATGQVKLTYPDQNGPGTDTIAASATVAGTTVQATATQTWTGMPPDEPIATTGTAVTATEGLPFSGQVATVTDPETSSVPGDYLAEIDWGDGTTPSVGTISGGDGTFTVTGTHTYAEHGSYQVAVTVTDADNLKNISKATSQATVADAALSATGSSLSSLPAFSGVVARFTDANPGATAADFAATIDWGDGSAPSAGTVAQSGSLYTVSGSHTYGSTGPFAVKVHVADVGGSTADATDQLLIYGTSTGGNFVVGDLSAGVGKTVTFWGAQLVTTSANQSATLWTSRNLLSGGRAPASFKGFEDDPTTAKCGQAWKTDPGNSVPPPAGPLPGYMAVIVSSSIKQTGSTLSGNTVQVVVVKTDPSYAPDPGHPGTGTVVQILCPAALAAPALIAGSPPTTATVGAAYSYTFAADGYPAPTFALASGALPNGLSLNAATGQLSGTPTKAGTFTFAVKSTNGASPGAITPTLTITVAPKPAAPTLTAASPPTDAKVGTAYSYSFAASGAPAPSFALASGELPYGFELDSITGQLWGTPIVPGTYTFTVRATNGVSPDAVSPALTITVNQSPSFTVDTPAALAVVGYPYSYTFAADGSPAPTFSVASGTLPDGLTLDSTTGVLSGTPTKAGTYTFTIKAANGVAPDAITPTLTITVNQPPSFTADSPPATATVGIAYSYTFTASGFPASSFTLASGGLPNGLSLDPTTGVLSGTPTTVGSFTFTVKATNGVAPDAVSPTLTVTVNQPPAFTAASPPATTPLGSAYSYTFTASGSPVPMFSVASGSLPDGLTLDATTGVLSGIATKVGSFTFTVKASNGVSSDALTPTLTITVDQPPTFTAASPPATATVATAYAYTFAADGYPAPSFALASGSLPDGLTLDTTNGVLSGIPTRDGTFIFSLGAANGVAPDAVSPALTIAVSPAPAAPTFTAANPPSTAKVGAAYAYTFAASGFPAPTFALASGSLPDGLGLDSASGVLSGTPTTVGSFTFTLKATNGVSPDAVTESLTIAVLESSPDVAPSFTAAAPPGSGAIGTAYSYVFAASGVPTPTFAVASGALPDGLSLDSASGRLSGTPTKTGTFTFTVRASNGVSPDAVTPTLAVAITSSSGGTVTLFANGDSYTVQGGRALDVPAPGVLANDYNPKNLPLTAVIEQANARGTVVLHSDGSLSYVPPAGFTGTDSFVYKVRDSQGEVSNLALVTVGVTSGGPPTPTLTAISPAAGTTITGPVTISATLTPPVGETVGAWTAWYHRPGDQALVQLATGTGSSVSASFDPTVLQDGTYAITIKAQSSGGGVLETETGLIVDGTYKPGRYSTTFRDLDVEASGIPIKIERTYDSIDKTTGDFGVGWTVGFANFRVDTNGPLGLSGWSMYSCNSFPFLYSCYKTSVPHFVTVTWPDGHVEKFDLTPPKSMLLGFPGSGYTAQPGSSSTLQALDNGLTLSGSNLLSGNLLSINGIYDPQQFVLTAKDGTQYLLDRHAGLLMETDTNGNSVTVDAAGIHSSSGPSVTFTRDSENRISQIVGPAGTIAYTYSAAGDLTAVQFPTGTTQAFTYDAHHDLLSVAGGGQVLRSLTYDASGRIVGVTDGNGHTATISTDVAGHQAVVTDFTGTLTTVNSYDDRGDLIQQDQTFAGNTLTTKFTYDALGRQLSVTDPLGHTTSQTYNTAGDVLTQTDANGKITSYTYNAFGQPLTVKDPTGAVTVYSYDARGNLLTTTDANGKTATDTYDGAGHRLTATDENGRTTTYTYDSAGHIAALTDPSGQTKRYTYDSSGRLISSADPTGATTSFTYDADGNPTVIADANGRTRTVTYDAFDRVTSLADPTGATVRLTYDPAGNLVSATDRNGVTTTYTYDAASRLTSKVVPGAGTTTYTYDPLGRLVGASNSTAQVTLTYDDADRIVSATSTGTGTSSLPTTTFTYAYDSAGNRTSLQGPDGATTYSYDAAERLASLTDPAGGAFAFGYDPVGQLTSLSRPNGIADAIAYDPTGDLTSLHSTLGTTIVSQSDYVYGPSGVLSSKTTTAGTTSYGYDLASRLTSATYPPVTGLAADSYTYDPVGNRTSTAASPQGPFTYDDASRLLGDSTYTYAYDKEGNLLSRTAKVGGATTSYAWSADHQLTGIIYPDGATASYRYDPLGRRVEIDEAGTITRYAYDLQSIAAEYDGSNTLIASYVQDPKVVDHVLEMTRGGQRYFYLADAQQSTAALATLSGDVAATYTYTAFGAVTATGNVANPFTYTGQVFDAKAGLYLFPLRAYDPSLGRFISEDPLLNVNPYIYAADQPTGFVDPTGADMTEKAELEYSASNYRSLAIRDLAKRRIKLTARDQIHHSLPQKFAELMREADINVHFRSFLRGVDKEIHPAITGLWQGAFPAGEAVTAADVIAFQELIDGMFGSWFIFV